MAAQDGSAADVAADAICLSSRFRFRLLLRGCMFDAPVAANVFDRCQSVIKNQIYHRLANEIGTRVIILLNCAFVS